MINNNKHLSISFAKAAISVGVLLCAWAAPGAYAQTRQPVAAVVTGSDATIPLISSTPDGYLERGLLMYGDANYRGAADQLRLAASRLTPGADLQTAEYYLARSLAHLPGEDATALMERFLEKYPASPYRSGALLTMAGALYDREDYPAALEIYRSVPVEALDEAQRQEKLYNEAYCLLKFGRYDEARQRYETLLSTPAANDARFYLGYIDYVNEKYPQALQTFGQVKVNTSLPTCETPYYLAQLYFRKGDYTQALKEAKALLATRPASTHAPEMMRVAGESMYATGDYAGAIAMLTKYIAADPRPMASSLYILGKDAYDKGQYTRAIDLLTPATSLDNAMGQGAYLLIGQAYMQLDNYDAALLALDQAVRKDFDPEATEMASYNYAVAYSKGGRTPFGSSVEQFEIFLNRFPDSPLAPRVAEYVVNGYITDSNYSAALQAINRIKNPSDKILAAKQKVTYLYGTRQLQGGLADEAASLLRQSRDLRRFDPQTASEAALWLGEALYAKGDYNGATQAYQSFFAEAKKSNPNHPLALYDMGYAQFALKDFSKAERYFNDYLKVASNATTPASVTALTADALNRLGDCSYYASEFAKAETLYARAAAESPSHADYPLFQQAVMKGLQRDYKGKVDGLLAMMEQFPSSPLTPQALLELGESYAELSQPTLAEDAYNKVSTQFAATPQGRQGALRLAITHLNEGDTDRAITVYKEVITRYPTSQEAKAASDDLKHIYADRGDITSYTRFIATVPDAPKMDQSEHIALLYEGVERAYEAGRTADAIRLAGELAETYPHASQTVDALAIKGEMHERLGEAPQALRAYTSMAEIAANEIDVNRARLGILRVQRDLGNDNAVLLTSSQLLASSALGRDHRDEVMLIRAVALRNGGDHAEADRMMATLAAEPATISGAKAAYYLAQSQFDRNLTDDALASANLLIDSNTPQQYWLARGFILLSDILRRQGKTFEAEEYLRSLRDNYPGTEPDIFQMIETRLQ